MHYLPFVLAFAPFLSHATPQPRAANPTVSIASGVVVGTATAVSNQPSVTGLVNAYLGIPFAKSPPLRFAPPEPAKKWSKPLVANKLPPACLQQFLNGTAGERERAAFNNPGLPPPPESEDCLYLNIFAPPNARANSKKSVLVWIFGGNLQFGTASLAYYNGSSLAVNHDVVVVAINYRTNIFGFSSSPEVPFGQQNVGFLDQRFALEWVQQNIEQFGGDPRKVTIFGESAGGFSVKQLLANPPDPLPFRAAILESQQLAALGNGSSSYAQVASHFKCSSATSTLECLRKVPGKDIQAYVQSNNLGFFPVVGDGTSLGANTLPSISSGKFADVPILIGTNKDEASVFLNLLGIDRNLTAVTDVLSSLGLNISGITSALLATYAGQLVTSSEDVVSRIVTDLAFTCTTSTFSSAIQNAGRQPVWRYRFDAAFPNLAFFNGPTPGAYHTSEIPSVFGTYPLDNQYGKYTPTEGALSAFIQGVWANFAKNPTAGPGWPRLGSNFGIELGILGGDKAPAGENTVPLLAADYPCALFDPILIAAGLAF